MRLLHLLTYYRPHVSGLTLHVQRLAEGLAQNGHEVTVLASRTSKGQPAEENLEGVRVRRIPVLAQRYKGVLRPFYPFLAAREIAAHDVVFVHLPAAPGESLLAPLLARMVRRPLVAVYHCDLRLPGGYLARNVERAVRFASRLAGRLSSVMVVYTDDYARNCLPLHGLSPSWQVVPPPVDIPAPDPTGVSRWRETLSPDGAPLIGMAARLAREKGVEHLAAALEILHGRGIPARVAFAGEYRNVLGEEAYRVRLQPILDRLGESWRLLGPLAPETMADFFSACDVTVLPSVNATESFGLVQVESMLCGTPVVATDMPGVRVPIATTGMGIVVPPGDSMALADALERILRDPGPFLRPKEEISGHFSTGATLRAYDTLLKDLAGRS